MFNKLREWTNKLKIWYKKWVKINLTDIPIIDIILICCFIFILVVTYLVILKGVFHKERGVEYFIKCNYYIFGFLFLYIIIINILPIVGIKKYELKREIKEANKEIYDIVFNYRKWYQWRCLIIIFLSYLFIATDILLYYDISYTNANVKPDTSIVGYTLTVLAIFPTIFVFIYTFLEKNIDSLVVLKKRILADQTLNYLLLSGIILILILCIFYYKVDDPIINIAIYHLLKISMFLYLFLVWIYLLTLKETIKFTHQQSIKKYLTQLGKKVEKKQ